MNTLKNKPLLLSALTLFFLAFSSTLSAQITTQKVNPTESFASVNGFVYALPMVTYRIEVQVEKLEHIKGPYTLYANKLLGLSDVTETNYESYKIKDIALSAEYVADPSQLYYIQLGEISGKSDQVKFFQMNQNGLFGGVISESLIGSTNQTTVSKVEKVVSGSRDFRYFADANLIEKADTIIRRVDVDTATIEKAVIKRYSIEKDFMQRAQDAATQLMEIRKNRFELVSGFHEVAYSEGTFRMMNEELNQMENEYIALFAGKTLVTDQHFVFFYTPTPDQPNVLAPIFKFSEQSGLAYLSAAIGEKVSLAIKSNGLAEQMADTKVSGAVSGIVYRYPETAEVWMKYGNQEYDKQLSTIPQFGKIQKIQVNQNTFELYPTTGGLKLLEVRK
jgi:hypothetical protein